MSDKSRPLELELLLQRAIPGDLGIADEPFLLEELATMGFDPARHAALAKSLTELLSNNLPVSDEAPPLEPPITETPPNTDATIPANNETSVSKGAETDTETIA